MTIQIGRWGLGTLTLPNPDRIIRNGNQVAIEGWAGAVQGAGVTTRAQMLVLRDQFANLSGPDEPTVPLVYSYDSTFDGYYEVVSANITQYDIAGSARVGGERRRGHHRADQRSVREVRPRGTRPSVRLCATTRAAPSRVRVAGVAASVRDLRCVRVALIAVACVRDDERPYEFAQRCVVGDECSMRRPGDVSRGRRAERRR
jgi:hypothetical protein